MWDLRRPPVVSPTPTANNRAELKERLRQLQTEAGTSDEPDDGVRLRIRQLRGQ
jgi:aryl-alcohol dehydrogenase-like predicted oxidoreductase